MKIVAFNLPQFHEIPENNEWWGNGFTEWTNIKADNKYSDGIKPLNGNYYNFLEKSTMQWQADLCKQYGVYGMCYYHYYFNGRLLLEKPVENLLKWKDIDQKFCFCWANHTWYRSWNGSKEVLLEQTYGEEEDWQKHFEYLKPFFEDDRYIKIDNKPVFVVFNAAVDCLGDMMSFLDSACKKIGFAGIYYIQSVSDADKLGFAPINADEILTREPDFSFNAFVKKINRTPLGFIKRCIRYVNRKVFHIKRINLRKFNGNKLMRFAIKDIENAPTDRSYLRCAWSMWDNTYRHKWRGYKISRPSKEVFEEYLRALKNDCERRGKEYIFFNAWNEWAEGMILEPEEKYGYYFLESIKKVVVDEK